MERDGESPVDNTTESSPLIQQTSAGPQSPVPLSVPTMPVSEVGTNQEVTQGELIIECRMVVEPVFYAQLC